MHIPMETVGLASCLHAACLSCDGFGPFYNTTSSKEECSRLLSALSTVMTNVCTVLQCSI
jgi:hypothetical protein